MRDTVLRTYFSVWVRWDPNKAKSNSIHWVSQRVESKQNCFRTTLRTTSCPNPVVWERLLHTGAPRSAFHTHTPPRPLLLPSTLQHKQSRYGAASRFHTKAPGSLFKIKARLGARLRTMSALITLCHPFKKKALLRNRKKYIILKKKEGKKS